jgi:hypothetical protein
MDNHLQTLFSGLVAIFTFIYVVVTYRQFRAMRQVIAETQRSNTAVEKSNEIAERSLKIGNRAWLCVSKLLVESPGDPNDRPIFHITISNVGRVPALGVNVFCETGLGGNGVPDEMEPECGTSAQNVVIGPGAEIEISHPGGAPANWSPRDGSLLTWFCLIRISYRDLFKERRNTMSAWEKDSKSGQWNLADRHNDLD